MSFSYLETSRKEEIDLKNLNSILMKKFDAAGIGKINRTSEVQKISTFYDPTSLSKTLERSDTFTELEPGYMDLE